MAHLQFTVCFGDWLYFARGPFSAKAIELRTAAPGPWPLHPGWHDPWVALIFYLKVSLLDSVAPVHWGNVVGNCVLALAALGTLAAGVTQEARASRRAFAWILLLWLPVPFYTWSVAYGSVPIFSPAWWPFTLYNTRYGLELLPALAVGLGFAVHSIIQFLHRLDFSRLSARQLNRIPFAPLLAGFTTAVFLALAVFNQVQLLRAGPLVYVEGIKNLEARLPYDEAIPPVLEDLLSFLPHAPVLMNTSTYPEIVALTGIPLRQTINESDLAIFRAALARPATSAAVIVTFQGDEVDRAVRAHPEDLAVAGRFTAEGQPQATCVYFSNHWLEQSPLMKLPATKNPLIEDRTPPPANANPRQ